MGQAKARQRTVEHNSLRAACGVLLRSCGVADVCVLSATPSVYVYLPLPLPLLLCTDLTCPDLPCPALHCTALCVNQQRWTVAFTRLRHGLPPRERRVG